MPFLILLLVIAFIVFVSLETLIKLLLIFAILAAFAKGMCEYINSDKFEGFQGWQRRWEQHPDEKPKRTPYV